MAAISLILIVRKNFKLPTHPKSLGLWFSSYQKTRDANFLFSEYFIGSFFCITHLRFHFNIYAWLHLKHLCMDIYASLVYPSSHLCVVLHFLIFIHMVFTNFRICKTFRAFKITFIKLKENQQLVNTPDFTLNYFLKLQRLES